MGAHHIYVQAAGAPVLAAAAGRASSLGASRRRSSVGCCRCSPQCSAGLHALAISLRPVSHTC